jgi:subtilase family serine protease
VTTVHADVISESFGTTSLPGSRFGQLLAEADNAAVAAGVTVVESSGDSGPQGTMITAADDPEVIAAGGVDNLHIVSLNDGYRSYVSNNMAAQSSGATAPTGKVVDLVASDWFGGETDCAPNINGCPDDYPIEAAAGTSEASPLIAGAAADVIQAYRDTHNGASPTRACRFPRRARPRPARSPSTCHRT